jgi:hypothetical protein
MNIYESLYALFLATLVGNSVHDALTNASATTLAIDVGLITYFLVVGACYALQRPEVWSSRTRSVI